MLNIETKHSHETYSFLQKLVKLGVICHVISEGTNGYLADIYGLERGKQLTELYGCRFVEYCIMCGRTYKRTYDVTKSSVEGGM